MTLAEQLRAEGVKSQHQQNLDAIIESLTERIKKFGETHPSFAQGSGWGSDPTSTCFHIKYMTEIATHFRNQGMTVQTRYAWEVHDMDIYLAN